MSQGGFKRLYSGYPPSLLMGGLCRFGDIGIYSYVEDNFNHKSPLDRLLHLYYHQYGELI